jgi:hypothetical protein
LLPKVSSPTCCAPDAVPGTNSMVSTAFKPWVVDCVFARWRRPACSRRCRAAPAAQVLVEGRGRGHRRSIASRSGLPLR